MGYFGNATVFAREPDWEGLGALPFAIRAYRHRRKPVWVVGISDHRSFDDPDETFHVYVPTRWTTEAANRRRQAPEVIAVLDRLAAVRRTLKPLWDVCLDLDGYLGLLAFAAEMARRAGVPAYFFAANDEMLDIGCLAAPDRFERFAFACSHVLVDYRDDAIHLAPYGGRTDDPEVAELLGRCAKADGVQLRRFTKADGLTRGRLYGIAAALWPKEMAPAKTALKIGSGNPFDYVERDLQVIAERRTDEGGPLEVRPLDRTPARPRGLRPERVDLGKDEQAFRFRHGELMIFSPPGKGATETLFLDVGRWPPRIERLGEYVDSIDRSRGGRWVMLTQFPERVPVGEHDIWRHEVRLRDDPFAAGFSTLACGGPLPELGVVGVGFLGERVVADPFGGSRRIERLPLLQRGELLVQARGASPVDRIIELSVVRLGDGSEVLVWDTGGYELKSGRLIRTFDLGLEPGRSPIPAGDDGFYYLAHGKLFEARRGRPPRRHAPWLGHINSLAAGPDGSLLLHEYYTWNKELGEIYFPEDGGFARLELAHIKEEEPEDFESLHWLPGSDRLLVAADTRLWSLPGEFIRGLPRRAAVVGG